MTRTTRSPIRRRARRPLAWLAALAAALVAVVAAPATPAHAVSPYAVFQQWVGGSTIAVGGTYRPIVGNFGGNRGDDIFWYAPGPTPDYLWISSTTRGSWQAKVRKDISGTYVPLVGDFAGDSYDDILWYGSGTTPDTMWTSVDTPALFSSKPYAINGVYQPVALDAAIPWAGALATSGTPSYASPTSKDTIVWYRPGTASDLTWTFSLDGDGSFAQAPIAIDGSPRLVPLNVDGDIDEDLLAYQPGTGADALFTDVGTSYAKSAKSVNGTYSPVVLGGGYQDQILWHGPGSAADAYWANGGWYSPLQPIATNPIATAGPIATTSYGDAFLFDPTGADRLFTYGQVLDALDPEQTGSAQLLQGDFDNDLGLDAFFYRPGAGAEVMAFDQTPNFTT